MKESAVEKYLHERITEIGGTTRKWVSPNRCGVPDRICILPPGFVFFVEVKTDVGKLSVRQTREIASLKELGCLVYVVQGREGVDAMMREVGR
jgi:hypothetical protein